MINVASRESNPKFNDRLEGVVRVRFPGSLIISDTGKQLVMNDPNVSFRTIKSLYKSEHALLCDSCLVDFLEKRNYNEVYQKYFIDNNQTGLVHLGMVISSDLEQCMAEIMIQYSDECRIPFIEGAVRIRSYYSVRPFQYYVRTRDSYTIREWKPSYASRLRVRIQPPTAKAKTSKKRTYSTFRRAVAQDIPDCPLCGAKADVFRCGIGMRDWHVCCEDSENECANFFGLAPKGTQREAALDWIHYCRQFQSTYS